MPKPRTTNGTIERVYFDSHEVALILHVSINQVRVWVKRIGLHVHRRGQDYRFKAEQINTLLMFRKLIYVDRYTLDGAVMRLKEELRGAK